MNSADLDLSNMILNTQRLDIAVRHISNMDNQEINENAS
jgi:hypothetical protein